MKKILAIALIALASITLAFAQGGAETSTGAAAYNETGFTNDTLTFVIPGSAGGGTDLAIRTMIEGLQRIYGLKVNPQQMKNTQGHTTVKNAAPDGNTIMLATAALLTQYVSGNSDVNPLEDLTLIATLDDNGYSVLAVPVDAPYNTFLFGKLESVLGIELNHVECASESDRLTNIAGGFIDIGVVGLGNAISYEAAGKLKVIGTVAGNGITIADSGRELGDNYKTLQEQGYDDCYVLCMHYVYGPKGMNPDQVAKLNASFKTIIEDPTVNEGLRKIGHIPLWHDLEESKAIQMEEYNTTVETAKFLGLYAL